LRWHSAADASRPAALLVGRILPVFSLLAPCGTGASAPSVRHRIYEMDHLAGGPLMRTCQNNASRVTKGRLEPPGGKTSAVGARIFVGTPASSQPATRGFRGSNNWRRSHPRCFG